MLVTALEIDGHEVDEADNALAGLRRLQDSPYSLVLTDYAMPGGTGTWMLHEADRRGLMADAVALIITAHPDVGELADVRVISKPLDLDFFLDQVRKLLATKQPANRRDGDAKDGNGSDRAHKAELVLYVSSASPVSAIAQRTIERLLARFNTSQVKFSVCDLVRDPLAGDADRIAFTPTLVKKYPEPKMWLVGNLRDPELLADLLRGAGVDAT